jgi:hypothetical protein
MSLPPVQKEVCVCVCVRERERERNMTSHLLLWPSDNGLTSARSGLSCCCLYT